MQYDQLLEQMTPAIYQRLKQALELGKWPDGRQLSQAQKDTCMEAVLRYQAMHLPPEEHSGFIKDNCESSKASSDQVLNIH
ncbi:MAG: DUF1315 family protein [Gammaproteobacteria bacterium]|nr:DUF1315 family protein [Gammaproteobacteria bacterium]